jgi:hypothetical protein
MHSPTPLRRKIFIELQLLLKTLSLYNFKKDSREVGSQSLALPGSSNGRVTKI